MQLYLTMNHHCDMFKEHVDIEFSAHDAFLE